MIKKQVRKGWSLYSGFGWSIWSGEGWSVCSGQGVVFLLRSQVVILTVFSTFVRILKIYFKKNMNFLMGKIEETFFCI